MSKNLISLENVKYSLGNNIKFRLNINEFILKKSDSVLIYGESGAGKSTFLNLLSGTLNAQEGNINILGTNIAETTSSIKDKIRGDHFGIVFQTFNLLPYISVKNNILLGKAYSNRKQLLSNNDEVKILMQKLSLNYKDLIDRKAYELSIGQQQRVAVARALIGKPEIIIADEPTSALDSKNENLVIKLLKKISKDKVIIISTHKTKLMKYFNKTINLI